MSRISIPSDTPVTPADLVPPGRPLNGDSYDNMTLSTKLGADLTDNFDVGPGRALRRYQRCDFTARRFRSVPKRCRASSDNARSSSRAAPAHLVLFDGTFDQTLGIAYTDYQQRFFDPNAATMRLGDDPSDYHGDRIKVDWQGNIKLDGRAGR